MEKEVNIYKIFKEIYEFMHASSRGGKNAMQNLYGHDLFIFFSCDIRVEVNI